MAVKAELRVILKANDVEVAESQDPIIWQRVFAAITGGIASDLPAVVTPVPDGAQPPAPASTRDTSGPVNRLAAAVGIDPALILGSCGPITTAPFVQLDAHAWEAMKKALPQRGTRALAPIQLSATLLGLWFNYANLGTPTLAQAQAVLATINQRDTNAARGLSKADWLQVRPGGSYNVNPAHTSRAIAIAKSYATRDWSTYLAE